MFKVERSHKSSPWWRHLKAHPKQRLNCPPEKNDQNSDSAENLYLYDDDNDDDDNDNDNNDNNDDNDDDDNRVKDVKAVDLRQKLGELYPSHRVTSEEQ